MPVINDAQKTRDRALTLAAQGLSYAQAGQWVGCCVKSTIGRWLRRTPLTEPRFVGKELSLEMDGLWTRSRAGRTELKVIRDANTGAALGAFGRWAAVPGGISN